MHVHILGVCGTFMGGIAALAKARGHRVTGSDRNVYPPMSTQLEALGVELIAGLRGGPAHPGPGHRRGRQRHDARHAGDRALAREHGIPFTSGPQWLAEHVLQRPLGAGGIRDARQDHDLEPACLDSRACRTQSRVPHRRRAGRLRHHRAPRRRPVLRDRGGRVRHRLLRQALEVGAPARADRHRQQHRVRPRRHLRGRACHPAPVSPVRAAHSGERTHRRECRRRQRACRCSTWVAGRRSKASRAHP